ncbi:MAG: TonB-dependent receptor [Candidatus Binatus sp.]|uniref:TonB-dependent receptor plug domain-containing protein n=1 Tax=Candidatus Binatus sp. TaxID=2811406 RepID=UPI002725359E|nr:TonB-dependent receptor [Candidatus Binatus sp.]MDO8430872.1 TonB-dependent receptor [Candidatus Binatus sp.]
MRRAFQLIVFGIVLIFLFAPILPASGDDSTTPQSYAAPAAKSAASSGSTATKKSPATTATPAKSAAAKPPAQKPSPQKLSPIVVTATRIPQPIADIGTTISVVEDSQIEAQKIERVENVLRQVPGLQVTQGGSPGSVTDVSIRGAPPSSTLVLIDGVEVNAGATGSFDFANLTTNNLDRIEVLRGAGGSLYGSQAIGGVINLLSREGEGAPKFTLLSEGGNRATSRQVGTVNGAQGNLSYSGALSYYSTEGYRQFNDNSDNLSTAGRLDYHLGDNTVIRGFARYTMANVSLPRFSIASGLAGAQLNTTAHQRSEFMMFKGEIEHRFSDKLLARISAFYVRQELRVNSTPYVGNPTSEIDRIPDETRGGLAEAVYTWMPGFRTVAGFDFKDRWVRSDSSSSFPPFGTFTSNFNARRQEYAGYLEQEGSFFNGHVLGTAGFRVDGNSQFGEEVSPAWSVAIPLAKISTTLRGSYSEGFRAPSFNELYFPNFGNPDLQPIISSEYDGGFTTLFGERASLTATYFSRRVHNLIVAVPAPGTLFGVEAGNAGRVDTQGVEIVPSITILKGLTLGGNVTILDQTHANASGATARPVRVAKYTASALVQYVRSGTFLPHDRITASIVDNFLGDRDDIRSTFPFAIENHPAYNRVDAVASYALGVPYRWCRNEETFVKISNMMDRQYSEAFGFPAPSINFVAGVKLDFGE